VKAAVTTEQHGFEVIEIPDPTPGPGELVIRVAACGVCGSIEPVTALLKELTIRFSVCCTPDEFREVIAAFGSGAVDPAPMVGPALGLNRIAEAFDLVRGARVHGRVLVTPGSFE
jgi:(R,R)-butanediol dehydrogenase/meso-butanediol dehydrogenase/diacetyl reductase